MGLRRGDGKEEEVMCSGFYGEGGGGAAEKDIASLLLRAELVGKEEAEGGFI